MRQWHEQINNQRRDKDRFFSLHPDSPVGAAHRTAFQGLAYYPPDAA